MKHHIDQFDYFARFITIYANSPSLAIWRSFEAIALSEIAFEPPLLDLACGTGRFGRVLSGNKIGTGCDLDKDAIWVAAKESSCRTLSVADARALPYPDSTFNSVLANCALEHIPDVEQVIAEVARVLKPRGIFAFTVPSEHFNDFIFPVIFYSFLGLHYRARKHIQWYSNLQQHYHLDSLSIWEKRLNKVRFTLILHRFYMPMWPTLIFSLWDIMAKWTIQLPGIARPIRIQQFFLNRIPHRLLLWILHCHLAGLRRASLNVNSGSGLLVVSRKGQERH
jgi:ubiquinone/menaquinone biosynthesis C-methylase UbiE